VLPRLCQHVVVRAHEEVLFWPAVGHQLGAVLRQRRLPVVGVSRLILSESCGGFSMQLGKGRSIGNRKISFSPMQTEAR